ELDLDLARLDVAVGVRLLRRAEDDGLADGDAGRPRDAAGQLRPGGPLRGHSGSPKPAAMSRPMASTPLSGSPPPARTSMVVPCEPQRSSTPITLFALALCPSGPETRTSPG